MSVLAAEKKRKVNIRTRENKIIKTKIASYFFALSKLNKWTLILIGLTIQLVSVVFNLKTCIIQFSTLQFFTLTQFQLKKFLNQMFDFYNCNHSYDFKIEEFKIDFINN
ncbi:hypothetical protein BpHYR1_036911 [Brachionus plicatilis]|uniref:Transmembrane protein n=1 Tax=Brachionus plicatilis TaxID=10195 RepID=A0A3M7RV98_BRAPC|nr:hypothetical protein BpHYR1_036911 [Brachionus plicatilis]